MSTIEYEDKQIVSISIDLLTQDQYIILCTVVKCWGSSPRPVGSMMLISEQGKFYGSVSGGCIEDDLLEKYIHGDFDTGTPLTLTYDANHHNPQVKIPCGSILEIIVEKIYNDQEFKSIYKSLSQGQRIIRKLNLHNNTSSIEPPSTHSKNLVYTKDYLIKAFGPEWRILVIGASHITDYIIPLAEMLTYQLIVCEPRKEYRELYQEKMSPKKASPERKLPERKSPESKPEEKTPTELNPTYQITALMPDDAVEKFATDFHTIVLALSHDPKLDDMALIPALQLNLFYVGAIGSKKTCQSRNERLLSFDLSPDKINNLHAPVGLDINSKTPAEIALSIFAHLTKLKNNLQ